MLAAIAVTVFRYAIAGGGMCSLNVVGSMNTGTDCCALFDRDHVMMLHCTMVVVD